MGRRKRNGEGGEGREGKGGRAKEEGEGGRGRGREEKGGGKGRGTEEKRSGRGGRREVRGGRHAWPHYRQWRGMINGRLTEQRCRRSEGKQSWR